MEPDYLRPLYLCLLERTAEIQESTIKPRAWYPVARLYLAVTLRVMSRRHSTERKYLLQSWKKSVARDNDNQADTPLKRL